MASILMLAGGAIINGFAFSGSNYLFSKLSKSDDAKRHYEALEKLQAAQDAYQKKRLAMLDFINQRLSNQRHAEQTFTDVDQAMKEYYRITGNQLTLPPKPKESDYLYLSEDKKIQEILFITVGTVAVYFFATKING